MASRTTPALRNSRPLFVGWGLAAVLALPRCLPSQAPPPAALATGVSWPEADPLFQEDSLWLGADGAYSTGLGGNRVAWFFGDTFVATSPARLRAESKVVRNTVAVETGLDPTTATMQFAWKTAADGSPASFFAEQGDTWHWPGGAVRIPGGPLIVFLAVERATSGGLGFSSCGWRAAAISNPDAPPGEWQVAVLEPPPQAFDAVAGTAAVLDGDHVIALAASSDASHRGYLARFPVAALLRGDLSAVEWWDGGSWVAPSRLFGAPAVVIDDAGSEASLHRDPSLGVWIHLASRGFGATTLALRTAAQVTGPWSGPADVFDPPESRGPSPFVYAGKGHPELAAPGGSLAVTYATNSFTFSDLLTPDGMRTLGWPRFVRLTLSPR